VNDVPLDADSWTIAEDLTEIAEGVTADIQITHINSEGYGKTNTIKVITEDGVSMETIYKLTGTRPT
jgi:hypothetical protein